MDTNTATKRSGRILVMGLGNRVMTDDAAGLVALEQLRGGYELPETVDLLDGGTLGLDLLGYMEGYGRILIADCLASGRPAGKVVRVEGEEIETVFERCLSPHQMGLKDLIAVLRLQGRMPGEMTVIGVEGRDIDLGLELSEPVAAAMGKVVGEMVAVLGEWGVPVRRR